MAVIAWTDEARQWLEDIFEYIAADNPEAATWTVQGIYERAQVLAEFPEIGYRYQVSPRNVRVLLHGHYRIAYLIKDDGTSISSASSTVRSTSRGTSSEWWRRHFGGGGGGL